MVAASAELLGVIGMCGDLGLDVKGEVYADSAAALGISNRTGVGKVRHLRIQSLWVQEVRSTGRLAYKKVLGTLNPSDVLTKHVPGDLLDCHLKTLGFEIRGGRADAAPNLDSITSEQVFEWIEVDEGPADAQGETVTGRSRKKVSFDKVVSFRGISTAGLNRPTRDARKTKSTGLHKVCKNWADATDEERGVDCIDVDHEFNPDHDHGHDYENDFQGDFDWHEVFLASDATSESDARLRGEGEASVVMGPASISKSRNTSKVLIYNMSIVSDPLRCRRWSCSVVCVQRWLDRHKGSLKRDNISSMASNLASTVGAKGEREILYSHAHIISYERRPSNGHRRTPDRIAPHDRRERNRVIVLLHTRMRDVTQAQRGESNTHARSRRSATISDCRPPTSIVRARLKSI